MNYLATTCCFIVAHSASAVTTNKKSSINTNRKSSTRFPISPGQWKLEHRKLLYSQSQGRTATTIAVHTGLIRSPICSENVWRELYRPD